MLLKPPMPLHVPLTGSFKHRATMLPAHRAAAIMPSAHNTVPDAA